MHKAKASGLGQCQETNNRALIIFFLLSACSSRKVHPPGGGKYLQCCSGNLIFTLIFSTLITPGMFSTDADGTREKSSRLSTWFNNRKLVLDRPWRNKPTVCVVQCSYIVQLTQLTD